MFNFANTMANVLDSNIKRILREQNKDLGILCEELGISRQSMYKRINNNPTLATIEQIANHLGCTAPELLLEPCKKIVDADCANNEPVITNLIECPNCKQKLYVHAITDIK